MGLEALIPFCTRRLPPVIRNGVNTMRLFTTLLPCEIVTVTFGGALMNTSEVGPGTWPLLQFVGPCQTLETATTHVMPCLSVRLPASVSRCGTGVKIGLVTKNAGFDVIKRTMIWKLLSPEGTFVKTKLPSPALNTGGVANPTSSNE